MKNSPFGICRLTLFTLLIGLVLQGCAPKTTVVLLPDPDGNVGHITVTNEGGSVEMNKAGQATVVKGKQFSPGLPEVLPDTKIQADFAEALEALPVQPIHFILYFLRDSDQLTEESKVLLEKVMQSIKDRQSKNIAVCGHADTAGDKQYNVQLSRKRAVAVGKILVKRGVNPENISTTSHGENNPLIKTPDNTSEPRNRRVEVVIR